MLTGLVAQLGRLPDPDLVEISLCPLSQEYTTMRETEVFRIAVGANSVIQKEIKLQQQSLAVRLSSRQSGFDSE